MKSHSDMNSDAENDRLRDFIAELSNYLRTVLVMNCQRLERCEILRRAEDMLSDGRKGTT